MKNIDDFYGKLFPFTVTGLSQLHFISYLVREVMRHSGSSALEEPLPYANLAKRLIRDSTYWSYEDTAQVIAAVSAYDPPNCGHWLAALTQPFADKHFEKSNGYPQAYLLGLLRSAKIANDWGGQEAKRRDPSQRNGQAFHPSSFHTTFVANMIELITMSTGPTISSGWRHQRYDAELEGALKAAMRETLNDDQAYHSYKGWKPLIAELLGQVAVVKSEREQNHDFLLVFGLWIVDQLSFWLAEKMTVDERLKALGATRPLLPT